MTTTRPWRAHGAMLRYYRELRGLTLKELAESSGVSYTSISRIETGETPNPHFATMSAIADSLGVAVDELRIFEKPSPHPHRNAENGKES